jgi:hypothetical protein
MARLAGFEPTTPWFVAKYSIQLSYSRTQNSTTSCYFSALWLALDAFADFRERKQLNEWRGWQDSNPRPLGS